ncbi:hypothetical protein EJB05_42934, partial [Eragrostis curvula]
MTPSTSPPPRRRFARTPPPSRSLLAPRAAPQSSPRALPLAPRRPWCCMPCVAAVACPVGPARCSCPRTRTRWSFAIDSADALHHRIHQQQLRGQCMLQLFQQHKQQQVVEDHGTVEDLCSLLATASTATTRSCWPSVHLPVKTGYPCCSAGSTPSCSACCPWWPQQTGRGWSPGPMRGATRRRVNQWAEREPGSRRGIGATAMGAGRSGCVTGGAGRRVPPMGAGRDAIRRAAVDLRELIARRAPARRAAATRTPAPALSAAAAVRTPQTHAAPFSPGASSGSGAPHGHRCGTPRRKPTRMSPPAMAAAPPVPASRMHLKREGMLHRVGRRSLQSNQAKNLTFMGTLVPQITLALPSSSQSGTST